MAKSVTRRAASAGSRFKTRSRAQNTADKDNAQQIRSGTKQAISIEMLRTGASIDALMKATGWQQHSVRGFLAGVVRKRLGLKLESAIVEGQRVYRIINATGEKPAPVRARRSKA